MTLGELPKQTKCTAILSAMCWLQVLPYLGKKKLSNGPLSHKKKSKVSFYHRDDLS